MTYSELAENGKNILCAAGIENAAQEAIIMLCAAADTDTTGYLLKRYDAVSEKESAEYLDLIRQRAEHVPMQYLLRSAAFMGLTFAVGSGVLIPRPETEELAAICIDLIRARGYRTVFDLCAGTGCIGISVADQCPQTEVWLFEKYEGALKYLYRNIPSDIANRVHVVEADIFTCETSFLPVPDLIVSNPPYIVSDEIAMLQEEVQMEPQTALDGGADGLDFYRCIMQRWAPLLPHGGFLALECGETQTQNIASMILTAKKTERMKDMFGLYRFVTAEF